MNHKKKHGAREGKDIFSTAGSFLKRAIAGILNILMFLMPMASPAMAFAASSGDDSVPEYDSVKESLSDGEIVTARDYTVTVGDGINVKTDFTNIDYDEDKIKVELHDDGGFDNGRAGTYQATYYCEPVSGNPKYQVRRKIIVKEKDSGSTSVSSGEKSDNSGSAEKDTPSDDDDAHPQENKPEEDGTSKEAAEAEKEVSEMTDDEVKSEAQKIFDKIYEEWDEAAGKEYTPTERETEILKRYNTIINPVKRMLGRRLMATGSLPGTLYFDHVKSDIDTSILPSDMTATFKNYIWGTNTSAFCLIPEYSTNSNISYTNRSWEANAFYSALAYCYRYAPKMINASSSSYPSKYQTGYGTSADYFTARQAMRYVISKYTGTNDRTTINGAIVDGENVDYGSKLTRNNEKSRHRYQIAKKLYEDAVAAGERMKNGYSNNMPSISVKSPSSTVLYYDSASGNYLTGWYSVSSTDDLGNPYSVSLSGTNAGQFKVNNDASNNRFYISIPKSTVDGLRNGDEWNANISISVKQNVSRNWVYIYYPNGQSSNKLQSFLVGAEDTDTASASASASLHVEAEKGSISLKKVSAEPDITSANTSEYSLSGAVYTIYSDSACTKSVATLTTGADGTAKADGIIKGTYYVKETKASAGFTLDSKVYTVVVKPKETTKVSADSSGTVKETPTPTPTPPVYKLDKDNNRIILEGAEFTVKYYPSSGASGNASRTWVLKTDSEGYIRWDDAHFVSGDAFYKTASGQVVIPAGTLTYQETKAPEGYKINSAVYSCRVKTDGTITWALADKNASDDGTKLTVLEEPKETETDLLSKLGIHFEKPDRSVTLTDTVKYYGLEKGKTYTLIGKLVDADGNDLKTEDGTRIEFRKTFTPEKIVGSVSQTIKFDASDYAGKSVTAYEYIVDEDGNTIKSHAKKGNERQTVYFPEIKTNAVDTETGSHTGTVGKKVQVKDSVTYSGLKAGESYTVKGTLMDKGTGEALKDASGKEITAEKTFKADKSSGSVELVFTVDSTLLQGESVVAFENLYYQDKEIAIHAEITDKDQTVNYPDLSTQASDEKTKDEVGQSGKSVKVIDKVSYKNLTVGDTYYVKGTLMDRTSKKAVRDSSGKDIVVTSKKFTADKADGTIDITFTVDSSKLEGNTAVAYQDLYTVVDGKDHLVIAHDDINDNAEAVFYGKIRTNASDKDTKDHTGTVKKTATVIDDVTYENLVVGKEYTLTGTLMNKATGKAIKDASGKDITATQKFKAEKASGVITLTFTVDSTLLEGQQVVAFERVYHNGIEVFVHADINDEDQTVYYPQIRTKAVDSDTKTHTGTVTTAATVQDTVTYKGLRVGDKYTIRGTLMNKKTGAALTDKDGKTVTTEITFTAEKSDGSAVLTFTADSTLLAGQSVVAFEKLIHNNVEVTVHEDINDKDQTVNYPDLSTQASDEKTKDEVGQSGKSVKIIDKVAYKNLTVGDTYYVKGTLMDRTSKKAVRDSSGNDIVVTSKKFTADKADGTIDITFTVDSSKLEGNTAVAYQDLYTVVSGKDHLVIAHDDINDNAEAVFYGKIRTNASDKDTKDHTGTVKKTATVIDDVTYENLVVGKEYTLKGTLINKETGKAITDADGKEITATQKFTVKKSNGTIRLTFTLDSTLLEGHSVVAFEDLYHNGIKVAVHADITDEDQTVHYPLVKTTAVDADTKNHVGTVKKEAKVIDEVKYTNLVPGNEYTVKGTLMNKKTGKAITDADGKKITAELTFKPEKADGSVTLTFTLDSTLLEGQSVVAFEDLYHNGIEIAFHEDITDKDQTVNYPGVKTLAEDDVSKIQTGTVTREGKTTKVVDHVIYSNLDTNYMYRVSGKFIDSETGKELAKAQSEVFAPEKADGTIDIVFTLDTSSLASRTAVAYETLSVVTGAVPDEKNGGVSYTTKDVVKHENPDDKDELIFYPAVSTEAKDKDNGTHSGTVGKKVQVVDAVTYTNLIIGKKYSVSGVLMDKETGKPLLDDQGKEITASRKFTPEKADGTIDIVFTLDSSLLEGKTIVTFEDLQYEKKTVVAHEDITDEDQTIYYPSVRTMALEPTTGSHNGPVVTNDDEAQALTEGKVEDTVLLKNLIPGYTYKVAGTLVGKDDGKVVTDKDGNESVSELTFKAGSEGYEPGEDGTTTVKLTFNVDASRLSGKSAVAFEKLYVVAVPGKDKDGNDTDNPLEKPAEVDRHEDLTDEDQTIHYPEVKTNAADGRTKSHTGTVEKRATVTDIVTYSNLIRGKKYKVTGVLMNKETGEPLLAADGKEITAEKEFIAGEEEEAAAGMDDAAKEETVAESAADGTTGEKQASGEENTAENAENTSAAASEEEGNTDTAPSADASGTVTLTFTLDSSVLSGKSVVAFETLYYEDIKIAVHADITDEDQTVHYPEVKTNATDTSTKTHTGVVGKKVTVTDRVTYSNVVPGRKYTVSGALMNKETGEALKDADGKEVTAQAEFTAEKADGYIDLVFTLDSTALAGKSVVAFEDLKEGEITVAAHADLTDADQTVHYPDVKTAAVEKTTRTHTGISTGKSAIVDTVFYENLLPEHTYTVKGRLVNKKTGKALTDKDGKEITAEMAFTTPAAKKAEEKKEGDKKETAASEAAKTAATGETQKAAEAVTEDKPETATAENTATDTTSAAADSTESTEAAAETADDAESTASTADTGISGSVELTFTFDGDTMQGISAVAYEDLYDSDVIVATHSDLTDEEQTVYYPQVRTNASIDGKKAVTASGKKTLVDKVTYKNLTAGKSYTVKGTLMDKSTGKAFKDADGKEVTAEKTFTPDKADGTVDLEFTFNTEGLSKTTIVAFEDLYESDIKIAAHADLTDKDQTVVINKKTENPSAPVEKKTSTTAKKNPKTGDAARTMLWIAIGAAAAIVLIVVIVRKRKAGK